MVTEYLYFTQSTQPSTLLTAAITPKSYPQICICGAPLQSVPDMFLGGGIAGVTRAPHRLAFSKAPDSY